jgi:SAM-dependent methyltransferase
MYCGAVERHRLTWVYFERSTDLFDGRSKQVLHVAPEPVFENLLKRRLDGGYITADLLNPEAMVKMDITDIKYPDETFDVIYCSHVLEHVSDDRRAMREFRRVLKPDGWAVLLVPITADSTFEDPAISDPARRLELFGQEDHVRRYGPDYVDRLKEAGFHVQISDATTLLSAEETARLGVAAGGEIYHCTRAYAAD